MKKKYIVRGGVFVTFISIFFLAGCRATPDGESVVNKAGGVPQEAVTDVVRSDQEKKIDVPDHWKEKKIKKNKNGSIQLIADTEVEIPKVSNTPVIEFGQEKLTIDKMEELIRYFCGDTKLYVIPESTKTELEKQKSLLQSGNGRYYSYDASSRAEILERFDEKIEIANNTVKKHEYIQPEFRKKSQTDMEYIIRGSQEVLDEKGKDYFSAMAESKDGIDPRIDAETYDIKEGTSSIFTYLRGGIFTEGDWQDEQEFITMEKDPQKVAEFSVYLEQLKRSMDEEGIEEKSAREKAEKVMKELKIEGFSVVQSQRGVWVPEAPEWGRNKDADFSWADHLEDSQSGYLISYTRDVQGINASLPTGGVYSVNTPETMYYPPFYQEVISIFCTEDGIQYFAWENMAKQTKEIAGNTKLISFDKISESLLNHLLYINTANDESGNSLIGELKYQVQSVKFQMAYTPAYKEPERAWLVPAWTFVVKGDMSETMIINAIDGGFIQNVSENDKE